jgi:transposase InsO family protein
VIDFVRTWSDKTEIPMKRFIAWLSISKSKFYAWIDRYGKANEHNAPIPRDFWLEDWEREAIIEFAQENPLNGYRRLTFMMLDKNIVAVSPATTWRVLKQAGLLQKWNGKSSLKGTGFVQPLEPHEHWHIDVSYLNLFGTFYYLCSILDGCSRSIVHWEIREQIKEKDIEIVMQRARERYPDVKPRIISDNGPQFIAKDFKKFVRLAGMTHVRTSPYYPQSNGKLERFHGTIKGECIRPNVLLSLEEARRVVEKYVVHYNTERLHSAIGFITPADRMAGRDKQIFKERDRKLEEARAQRKLKRQAVANQVHSADTKQVAWNG